MVGMSKYVASLAVTAIVAVACFLQLAASASHVDAQTILISGIALSTFGTAILTIYGQFQLNRVKKTGEATHMLSNSAMGQQLKDKLEFTKEIAVMSKRLAEYTKEPEAVAAAMAADVKVATARTELQDHLIRQAKVDALGSQ